MGTSPPAKDPAAPDLPGADADPGPDPADFGDGDPPDDDLSAGA